MIAIVVHNIKHVFGDVDAEIITIFIHYLLYLERTALLCSNNLKGPNELSGIKQEREGTCNVDGLFPRV